MLRVLERLREGRLELTDPGGNRLEFGPPGTEPRAAVQIHSHRFWGGAGR